MELAELSPEESWALLRTAAVGRVALVRAGLPSIVPVNVCAEDGAVWFRAGPGGLLDAALAGHVLSVEADEVDRLSHTGWSVVVTGRADVAAERDDLPVASWGRSDADHLVRVDAELVTGRRLDAASLGGHVPH
jgi:nitroimidazol reductase NimA-like FMN-containing flavoprotein (pyridoxamine 5'-phosphate oxidase superfamily)